MDTETWDGRQLTAGRALASLTVRQLAEKAQTTKRVVSELESRGPVLVSPSRRHGHVSLDVWRRILAVLQDAGVELLPESDDCGAGARWTMPRARRQQ